MSQIDFLNLFVRPPGDLLYFLTGIFISQAGLFMALGHRLRRPHERGIQRYTLATLGVVFTWIVLMAGALVALLTDQSADVVLPPLERISGVITILLLGWAFLTADHHRWRRSSNIVLLVFMAIAIAGYMITATQWASLSDKTDFNLSIFGLTWTFVSAVLSGLGLLLALVYVRVILDAPLKLVFFAILLIGYGGTLYQMLQGGLIGDYAGLARLAFLGALPIVPAVIYRMIIGQLEAGMVTQDMSPLGKLKSSVPETQPMAYSAADAAVASPVERQSVQLLRALGLILENSTTANIPQRIVLSAIDMLRADIGALLRLQDANYADVTSAYDKVMGRSISGMALNLDNQPTLVNAIERHAQRPLFPDRNIEELQDFYTRLDVNSTGPVYFQPLVHDKELVAVLAIAMPYSGRELLSAEEELLKGIAVIASSLLALSYEANDARLMAEERAIQAMVQGVSPDEVVDDEVIAARQEMQASLDLAREQITQLSRQVMQLKIQLDDERSRVASVLGDTQEGLSISQRLLSLNEEQQRLREERDQLAARLKEAEAALAGATTTDNKAMVQRLIEGLEREKTDLLAQKASLQAQVDDLRTSGQLFPQSIQDLLDRMSQEKARLEVERDQLNDKLVDIQSQLKSLGIEGPSGLSQLIGQLYEQRATLQARVEAFKAERDTLLSERNKLEDSIQREKERETRIQTLQVELLQLAADREAAIKQRDKLRVERDDAMAKLESIKQHRARLLAQVAGFEMELNEAHEEQSKLRIKIQQLADERSDMITQRDRLLAEKQSLETERDQLLARVEGDRDRLQRLGEDGVGSLTKMIDQLSAQRNQLEHELNETRTALASVENQLEMLKVRVDSGAHGQVTAKYQPDNPDLLIGLVQELRTPMTSISGYVDLLLGESAGILGEMQRKFLQRVSANVARLAAMLDDLVHLTELDTGKFTLSHAQVDVVGLIEDAITNAATQFREKGLAVQLNLEDDIPLLHADRDAITQIIGQLLTNAYLVSPNNSEVIITARRQQINLAQNGSKNQLTDSLVVAVEDRGGGIAPEDEARVFARKYKAENPLIAGLGDTGVGLSIAKALVEAHGGRLWLESRENIGSIFNFALPLTPELEPEGS